MVDLSASNTKFLHLPCKLLSLPTLSDYVSWSLFGPLPTFLNKLVHVSVGMSSMFSSHTVSFVFSRAWVFLSSCLYPVLVLSSCGRQLSQPHPSIRKLHSVAAAVFNKLHIKSKYKRTAYCLLFLPPNVTSLGNKTSTSISVNQQARDEIKSNDETSQVNSTVQHVYTCSMAIICQNCS